MKVGVLFGGRSVEHNISVISATAVADALQKAGHECVYIGIGKKGDWNLMSEVISPDQVKSKDGLHNEHRLKRVHLFPGGGANNGLQLEDRSIPLDVIFPVLHGTHGEDGKIQGALESCGIPYIGAGVKSSALTNDKDITKRLLNNAGIDTARHIALRDKNSETTKLKKTAQLYEQVVTELGVPFWVKPANLGSSLGIARVQKPQDFSYALKEAFSIDSKIILEEHIEAREMECSVLEDDNGLTVSSPGEIVLRGKHYFYDYDAKYNDPQGAKLKIPADLEDHVVKKIQSLARKIFALLECRNIMRMDMFVLENKFSEKSARVIINEIQTIPGFTQISMYPKLLKEAGIPLMELVDRLCRQHIK